MTIVKPNVEMLKEKDPFKKIETIGRVCYKSEDKITDDSAKKFVAGLIKSGHHAMIEHATFAFVTDETVAFDALACPFLHVTKNPVNKRLIVSGNLRAIRDSGIYALIEAVGLFYPELVENVEAKSSHEGQATLVDFEILEDKTADEIGAHRYTSIKFVTDRGVTHELVRHRLFSFAQESTRYVNYSKDKFGGGNIKFIEPADFGFWSTDKKIVFTDLLAHAENAYNLMICDGATPQEARAVLPNAVKTEIFVTGNDSEWQHFFNLRSKGTTGAPHPDMKVVADKAFELYKSLYRLE